MIARVQRGSFMQRELAIADNLTYIVVFSDDGTPIMAIEQVGRDHIQVTKANESTFNQIMHRLDVDVEGVTP